MSQTIVPRGATAPRFALGDRVLIVQQGIQDEYHGQTGNVSGVTFWERGGWHYAVKLDTPVWSRLSCLMTERELVAETGATS